MHGRGPRYITACFPLRSYGCTYCSANINMSDGLADSPNVSSMSQSEKIAYAASLRNEIEVGIAHEADEPPGSKRLLYEALDTFEAAVKANDMEKMRKTLSGLETDFQALLSASQASGSK